MARHTYPIAITSKRQVNSGIAVFLKVLADNSVVLGDDSAFGLCDLYPGLQEGAVVGTGCDGHRQEHQSQNKTAHCRT